MTVRPVFLHRRALLVVSMAGILWGAPELSSQEPVPTDTVPTRPDTVVVPVPAARDTTPAVEAEPDTLRPAPRLPELPRDEAGGFTAAEWEWDKTELGRWHGLTVLELIEQLPGIVVTRGGWYGQPAGVTAFGQGGGRLRVFLDGYELDALSSATLDMQHIAVADLEGLRVRRSLLETRVELTTFRLEERRPFSQIEASTGQYGTRFVRGLFSTVMGDEGMLTVGIDVTDTSGWIGQQPFSANGLLARWSRLFGERSGVEIEYRQARLARPVGTAFPLDAQRNDLVLRGRHRLSDSLVLDANLGRSWRTAPSTDTLGTRLTSVQGQVQARYGFGAGSLGAGLRLRDQGDRYADARYDLHVDGVYRLGGVAQVAGMLRRLSVDGVSGTGGEARLELGPFAGFRAFASVGMGSRGIGVVADTIIEIIEEREEEEEEDGEPIVTELHRFTFPAVRADGGGLRAGLEWRGGGARLGAAVLHQRAGVVAPFGLPFDRRSAPVDAEAVTGFEAFASIPLFTPALRIEGSHTEWQDVGFRPYLPEQFSRGALVFSHMFYGGNLEPTLRIEGYRRGSSIVPGPERTAFDAVVEPYNWASIFLQIRILDVRAFIIWESPLADRNAADLPGLVRGGARSYYGVRWHFLD